MHTRLLLVGVVAILGARRAGAQSLSLPKIDNINVFGQIAEFEGKDATDAKTFHGFGSYGWGFETSFEMTVKDSYVVELAVGYDQLFLESKLGAFTMHGTVRDLPSISAYTSLSNGLYFGIGTGLTSLANTTITDGTSRFTVSGDTFDLDGHVGYALALDGAKKLNDTRLNAFIDLGYHARAFGGVNYSTNAPVADLPSRLYLGGFVVAAGIQVSLKPSNAGPSAIKEEIKRQKDAAMTTSIPSDVSTTKQVCSNAQIEPGWVLVDTSWDPSTCLQPVASTQNVWVLRQYGAAVRRLEICVTATIPEGWKVTGSRWVPGRCGAPLDSVTQNVLVIER